jgi:hypothetical protein
LRIVLSKLNLTFVDKVKTKLQLVLSNIQYKDINLAKWHSVTANELYWLSFQKEIAEKTIEPLLN